MMTLNEFLLEYGRHPLGGGFTSGFREHLEAAVAERVKAAVARERERCAAICEAAAHDAGITRGALARTCAKRIKEADDE